MNRKLKQCLLWTTVLLTAAMIWIFSSQNAEQSAALSGSLLEKLLHCFGLDNLGEETLGILRGLIRKAGHFAEYALLGFLCMFLADSYALRYRGAAAWGGATGYAITDEIHQMMVAGRAGMVSDVLLDSVGVLTGIWIALILMKLMKNQSKGNTP